MAERLKTPKAKPRAVTDEIRTTVSEILRAVEHGETVSITRHGKAVARLVPASAHDRANRERAVERFRRRRAGWRRVPFSTDEILAMRHEGHYL